MKFDISTEARFHFTPSMAAIDLMIEMAKHHYDVTCKGMAIDSLRNPDIHADETYGVLHKWRRIIALYASEGSTVPETHGVITATWRQIDTLLKVMQDTIGLSDEQKKVREEIRNGFILAMNAIRPKLSEWQLTVDTEADK